jgi:hypothetical protein
MGLRASCTQGPKNQKGKHPTWKRLMAFPPSLTSRNPWRPHNRTKADWGVCAIDGPLSVLPAGGAN